MIRLLAILEDEGLIDILRASMVAHEDMELQATASPERGLALLDSMRFEAMLTDDEGCVSGARDRDEGLPILMVTHAHSRGADVHISPSELEGERVIDLVRMAALYDRARRIAEVLFDNPMEGIVILDDDNHVRYLNRILHSMIQGPSAQGKADTIGTSFLDHVAEEHRADFLRDQGMLSGSRAAMGIYELLGPGRERLVVETVRSRIDYDGERSSILFIRDVTERQRDQEALRTANDRMSTMNRIIRHDILNQLAVMNGVAELMRLRLDGPESRLVEKMERHIRTIHRQIAFTRDYQDLGVEPPAWLDLREEVYRAMSAVDLGDVRLRVETDGVRLRAAPQLSRAFVHLFENSVEHGGEVGAITVRFQEEGGAGRLVVEDDGVGIPYDRKEVVLGHGMEGYGLLLVREILSITGLTIVENGVPGEGARFDISVPPERYRME